MKKIIFLFLIFIFPFGVKAATGDIVFDVEAFKIEKDKMYIGGWALIAGENFSGGREIDLLNNVNAVIKIVAIGENNVETEGTRQRFKVDNNKYFDNNINNDVLFPSRCSRVDKGGNNDNICGQTIYKDSKDELKRKPLSCDGNGSSCLVRDTDFAFVFDLKELKNKYGNQTLTFKIKVEYKRVKLQYDTKYFSMVLKNSNDNIVHNVYSDLVVSETSILSNKNDVVENDDDKNVLIETGSYTAVIEAIGKKFKLNTKSGRIFASNLRYLYDSKTYWDEKSYTIVGSNFVSKEEEYDAVNGKYKACHYGTSYCTGNFSYTIKRYQLKYGGLTNINADGKRYALIGADYDDGYADATWGYVTGGLKLKLNDIFVPSMTMCSDNISVEKNGFGNCGNPSIDASCVHTVTKSVDYDDKGLTSNSCINNYKSKVIHAADYEISQNINISVFPFDSQKFNLVRNIVAFRGGSFSIGANYSNSIKQPIKIGGSDRYYIEYYIMVDGSCSPRYLEVNANQVKKYNLNIDNNFIYSNDFFDDTVTSTKTKWINSNDEKKNVFNTGGSSVFVNSNTGIDIDFNLREAYLNLSTGEVYYGQCADGAICKKISNEYFVPINFSSNTFNVDITFKNINKLKIMTNLEDDFDYSCSINVVDGKLDDYQYRVVDLTDPFPNEKPGSNSKATNWVDLWKNNNGFKNGVINDYLLKRKHNEIYRLDLNISNIRLYNEDKKYIDAIVDNGGNSNFITNSQYFKTLIFEGIKTNSGFGVRGTS